MNKYFLITGAVVLVILGYAIGGVGSHSTAQAEKPMPAKEKNLIDWIAQGSADFKTAADLEEKALEAAKSAMRDKIKAQEVNRGYRYSLCNEYHVKLDATGQVLDATDADCQSFR